jgi:hypothetical protein
VDDFTGLQRPRGVGYDIGGYESPFSIRVTDLRALHATLDPQGVNITLRWTAPANAVTYTIHRSNTLLTTTNWDQAANVTVPFTASIAGDTEWLTTSLDYTGDIIYFALRSQNLAGIWSELSNNAFWPSLNIYLPIILRYA